MREAPAWALALVAIVVLILAVIGFAASFWIGLSVVAIAAIAVIAYAAWTRLPERYRHGPDEAERRERRKRHEELYGDRERRQGWD